MRIDELYKYRSLAAERLKDCIRDRGYTKVSFATKAEISYSVLELILNGQMDEKPEFEQNIECILQALDMSVDEIMAYSVQENRSMAELRRHNDPTGHEMSQTAQKQYALLLDILDLCAIYY